MSKTNKILKVTICGPSDVAKEVEIAKQVVGDWNQRNWESTGWGLQTQHWSSDAIPTMAERGQAAINHRLIDHSDIVIAILWTRLGTPTGLAGSGTEEEITRAIARDIPVLAYFSNLEAPKLHVDAEQVEKLRDFRSRMMKSGLPFTFSSRSQFRKLLDEHLSKVVRDAITKRCAVPKTKRARRKPRVSQVATGNSNTQIAGDGNTLHIHSNSLKRPKVTIERAPDHISPADQKRVSDWIKNLAEESTGKPVGELIKEWWGKFYNHFDVTTYKDLRTWQMPEVEAWRQLQFNLLRAGRKTTDPQSWRNGKYASIKSNMKKMGRTEDEYYPELSTRLNMKKPFVSLTKLSKHDLERVAGMVKRDYEKWKR